jgi:hypothetical protein
MNARYWPCLGVKVFVGGRDHPIQLFVRASNQGGADECTLFIEAHLSSRRRTHDPHPVVRGSASAVVAAAYNQSGAGYMTEVGNSLQLATAPSACPLLRGQPPGRSTAAR